jgi:hypothetical protein
MSTILFGTFSHFSAGFLRLAGIVSLCPRVQAFIKAQQKLGDINACLNYSHIS